jgi:hypothetical protein
MNRKVGQLAANAHDVVARRWRWCAPGLWVLLPFTAALQMKQRQEWEW